MQSVKTRFAGCIPLTSLKSLFSSLFKKLRFKVLPFDLADQILDRLRPAETIGHCDLVKEQACLSHI